MSKLAKQAVGSLSGVGAGPREAGDLRIDTLENLTSRCKIDKGVRYLGDGKPDSTLKEPQRVAVSSIRPSGIVLDVPKMFCSGGHKLNANFNFYDGTREIEFKITCQVDEAEHEQGLPDRVELQFQVFDASAWSLVVSFYSERQQKVSDLFASLKGWKS